MTYFSKLKCYRYTGRQLGTMQYVSGELVAPNVQQARITLQEQHIAVKQLRVCRLPKLKAEAIAVLTRQFAVMVRSSLPMLQIFDLLSQSQTHPYLKLILKQIRHDLEQGKSLAQAFSVYPQQFDSFYCGVLAAGELGGVLDSVLDNLAQTLEQNQSLKQQIKKALTYPIMVIVMALLLIAIMMTFVLPEFEQVYHSVGASLPWLTQILINVAHKMPYLLPTMIVGSIILWKMCRYHYKNTPRWRYYCDMQLLQLPLVGKLLRKSTQAKIIRTLSVLFTAGVPLPEILMATRSVCHNVLYEQALDKVRLQVIQGVALSFAVKQTQIFDEMTIQMIKVGEETGALDSLLLKAAQLYENEVQHQLNIFSTLLEPMIMLVLGIIVAILLLAMYWPLFQLGNVLQ